MGNRLGLIALYLLALPVWAKIDFPPELSDDAAVKAHLNWIRTLVPESNNINKGGSDDQATALIKREQDLVRQLKADPDFMREANRRPDRLAITVRRVRTDIESAGRVSADWNRFLVANGFNSRRPQGEAIDEFASTLYLLKGRTSAGVFSGLAGLLPPQERKLLAIADPWERWQRVRGTLELQPIAPIRQRFDASRFGVNWPDWNLNDLEEAVKEILGLENRLAVTLEETQTSLVRKGQTWLLAESLENWLSKMEWRDDDLRVMGLLRKSLLNRFGDRVSTSTKETTTRQLILRQVPPYLAIFRGCVGNDCSTTHSWAYSYGPFELSFWIENEEGEHIGYISGAITQVKGEPTLYIRDVAGPDLQKGDINLILRGLFLSRDQFQARHMTIMPEDFTSQNHVKWQVDELRSFLGDRPIEVNQKFFDTKFRSKYFIRENSDATYDGVKLHTRVRWVNLTDGNENIRVAASPAQLPVKEIAKNADQLGLILSAALGWNDSRKLGAILDDEVDWSRLVKVLKNSERLPISQFHNKVNRTLIEMGLPSLRDILQETPFLVLSGELNAADFDLSPANAQRASLLVFDWSEDSSKADALFGVIAGHTDTVDEFKGLAQKIQDLEFDYKSSVRRLETLLKLGLKLPLVELSETRLIQILRTQDQPLSRLWALNRLSTTDLDPRAVRAASDLFSSIFVQEFQRYMKNGAELLYRRPGLFTAISESDRISIQRVILDDEVESTIRAQLVIASVFGGYWEGWVYRTHNVDDVFGKLLRDRKLSDRLREKLRVARTRLRKNFECERRLGR